MVIKQLFSPARRSHKPSSSFFTVVRSSSSNAEEFINPPPQTAMIYDRIAHSLKSKLRKLDNPDTRFFKYASPHPTQTSHSHILYRPETKITTLSNGLRFATESTSNSQPASVGVWIDAGSRYESDETNGTAHFLEHMIFEGTEKRCAKRMGEEIEIMGGHLRAHTSREQTAYHAKVMGKDVLKAVDILADILQNSKFEERCISKERDVILRELQIMLFWGFPVDLYDDFIHEKAIILDDHQRASAAVIQTHYTTPRMVLAASGAVKHDEIVEQTKKSFTRLSSDSTTATQKMVVPCSHIWIVISTTATQLVAKEPASFTGSEVRIINDYVPLAKFALAFEATSSTDPDSIALIFMREMLGSCNKNAGVESTWSELLSDLELHFILNSTLLWQSRNQTLLLQNNVLIRLKSFKQLRAGTKS
ncbi:putative mitochondrial-processing peptidase subunit beta [Hibiscus syriacus]|uniref:Mitochondrial-processing peptidase subunit beta n=1 Tax=Hibiscus syriacus TaxID=106335 RepID=A0A6A2ZUX7_HIBSY|nr:putative mitochondrial-processing peptidase subunit beta [Hibiscus syriacus]